MLELISVVLGLANTILSFIQTEELLKYVSQLKDLQTELNAEIALGQNADDAKIEALYSQIHVTSAAFQNQVAVLQAAKNGTTISTSSSGTTK